MSHCLHAPYRAGAQAHGCATTRSSRRRLQAVGRRCFRRAGDGSTPACGSAGQPAPAFDRGRTRVPAAQALGGVGGSWRWSTSTARGEAVDPPRRASIALDSEADLLAVHVIDSRAVFESDGPVRLPAWRPSASPPRTPRAAQRLQPAAGTRRRRSWAESAVLVRRRPNRELSDLIARWRPGPGRRRCRAEPAIRPSAQRRAAATRLGADRSMPGPACPARRLRPRPQ
ncbi:MAG: hypothetical protein MZW92_15180 [Comamonadaceae bacterium]|nr:hypothetical protein [Comamonadaceae bacterium]